MLKIKPYMGNKTSSISILTIIKTRITISVIATMITGKKKRSNIGFLSKNDFAAIITGKMDLIMHLYLFFISGNVNSGICNT